jgi:hypothetical protein
MVRYMLSTIYEYNVCFSTILLARGWHGVTHEANSRRFFFCAGLCENFKFQNQMHYFKLSPGGAAVNHQCQNANKADLVFRHS